MPKVRDERLCWLAVRDELTRRSRRTPGYVLAMAVIGMVGWFGHGDPLKCSLDHSGAGPSAGHPFGFDVQGCDLYSNVIYGTRASISIGVLTTAMFEAVTGYDAPADD